MMLGEGRDHLSQLRTPHPFGKAQVCMSIIRDTERYRSNHLVGNRGRPPGESDDEAVLQYELGFHLMTFKY